MSTTPTTDPTGQPSAGQDRATLLTCDGAGKPAKEAALSRLTDPADQLPAQIADALKILAETHGVSIHVDIGSDKSIKWGVFDWTDSQMFRHGHAETFEEANAMRIAAPYEAPKNGGRP